MRYGGKHDQGTLKSDYATELKLSQMHVHELNLENTRLKLHSSKLEQEWRNSAYLQIGFFLGLGAAVALYFLVKA